MAWPSDKTSQDKALGAASTYAALSAAGTFTSAWAAVDGAAYIAVRLDATAAGVCPGTLTFQFSEDRSTILSSLSVDINDARSEPPHGFAPVARYVRITYVNGSVNQTTFALTTFALQEPLSLTARINSTVPENYDVALIRVVGDQEIDSVAGKVGGRSSDHKFGRNGAVGSASEVAVQSLGGSFVFLQSAERVRVKAGGDAQDYQSGTGSRSFVVVGVDDDFNEATEEIFPHATDGTLAGDFSTNTFRIIYRVYSEDSGTFGGNNAGNVTLEYETSGDCAFITAGRGQSQIAMRVVPAGKTGYLKRRRTTVEGTKAANAYWWRWLDADVTSAPFSSPRIFDTDELLVGTSSVEYKAPIVFPEKSVIYITAQAASGSTAAVGAKFDIVFIDD